MRTARNAVLAAAVAVVLACGTDYDYWPTLGNDATQAMLTGLIDMANAAQHGAHTYPCPLDGGEVTITVSVASEQLGDTAFTRGRWVFDPLYLCRLAKGHPTLHINGDATFASETAVFGSGGRRFSATMEGTISWEDADSGFVCGPSRFFPPSVVEEKDADDDGPFTQPLVGEFCGHSVEIPLSRFPMVPGT